MKNNKNFNLRIKPHFSIIPQGDDVVELRSGVWNPISYTLTDENSKGKLLKILTALDGSCSTPAIAKKLSIPRMEIELVIDHLQQIDAIETEPSNAFDAYLQQASIALQTSSPCGSHKSKWPILFLGDSTLIDLAALQLKNSFGDDLTIKNFHDNEKFRWLYNLDSAVMFSGLELEKILHEFQGWKNHFIVYMQKHLNPEIALKLNRILYELKIPWIHAAFDGPFLLIGPTFFHRGPCYECFETRIGMNIKDHASYQKYKTAIAKQEVLHQESFQINAILQNLLVSHVTAEITNFCLTGSSFTQRKVLSIYLPTMEITFNEFLHYSNCKTCGADMLRDSDPLYFDFHSIREG